MFRILVMIDEPSERNTAVNALRECRYRVSTAACTREAALAVNDAATDLVLLDADLSSGETNELLRTLRDNPSSAAVPVVVAGRRDSTAELMMACALGATDFLMKPLEAAVFRHRIARTMQVAMADRRTWMGRAAVGVAA